MRCFISIELPEEAKKELIRIQEHFKNVSGTISFVKPENLHITFKFLGEISEKQANLVKEAITETKFSPFKAKLSSLGVFPSENFIKVLWAGVTPKNEITDIFNELDIRLSKPGFTRDKNFVPHITLARIKFTREKQKILDIMKKTKVAPLEFAVDKISFKKSTLTGNGPIYEDLI